MPDTGGHHACFRERRLLGTLWVDSSRIMHVRVEKILTSPCLTPDGGTCCMAQVTYEDRLAPTTPAFWCAECYEAMHYDQAGKLLYQHRVFPYHVN